MASEVNTFEQNGYLIIEDFLSVAEVNDINQVLQPFKQGKNRGGIRNIDQKIPEIKAFVNSERMYEVASKFVSKPPMLTRAIYFNKTNENNWLVSWHQDRTIAVVDKFDKDGWGPWTYKDGCHNVQPPISVLDDMVTLRIHLDESRSSNGGLRVIKGSHKFGILSPKQIDDQINECEEVSFNLKLGSLLAMKPHILHSSGKAVRPDNRRIIHAEYWTGIVD